MISTAASGMMLMTGSRSRSLESPRAGKGMKRVQKTSQIWGIVKIMVPFWVPIIRGQIRDPKRDHNFDSSPYAYPCRAVLKRHQCTCNQCSRIFSVRSLNAINPSTPKNGTRILRDSHLTTAQEVSAVATPRCHC